MLAAKRSKLSDMSQNQATTDTSIGRERAAGVGKMRMGRGAKIDLPQQGDVPAEFCVTRNYPGKKWSADTGHIKYRLDNNKDLDTIHTEVLQRMFKYNQPYLQAILDGEVECLLHQMFQETEPPHDMPVVNGCQIFGNKGTNTFIDLLMKELELGVTNVSGKCHLCMSVLLPELVVKMIMDMNKLSRADAITKISQLAKQLSDYMMEHVFKM